MMQSLTKTTWVNLAGAGALVLMIAAVSSAEAGQDPIGRKDGVKGTVLQKGRETATVVSPGAVSGITGGAVVARSPEQTACETGSATACRTLEAGLVTGGAWAFADGGVEGLDDWERQSARATGNHIPNAVIVQRVLAACDGGDVTACRAFAASVRPATAAEHRDTRSHTAGR